MLQIDPVMAERKPPDDARQKIGRDGRDDPDPEHARQASRIGARRGPQFRRPRAGYACMRAATSSPRLVNATCRACRVRKAARQASASISRICTDRAGCADRAGLRRAAEMPVARQRIEIAQLFQGQVVHNIFLSNNPKIQLTSYGMILLERFYKLVRKRIWWIRTRRLPGRMNAHGPHRRRPQGPDRANLAEERYNGRQRQTGRQMPRDARRLTAIRHLGDGLVAKRAEPRHPSPARHQGEPDGRISITARR
jgi:hypothetical protein